MKNLQEKHLIAVEQSDFYLSKVEKSLENLLKEQTMDGSSIWNIQQTKDITIKKAKELDSLPLNIKLKLPLFGLSVGAKDLFCIEGMITTAGSKILENFIPPYTATVVKQIEEMGGLVSGKTAMDEFAMGSFTNTSFFGKTVIPNHPNYTPGGSSGGSSAALMADLFDFTLGSDTGGSVRQPAAFCGLVGYKPSYGSFSRYGMISYASSLDQAGFMTKTIEDLDYLISSLNVKKDKNDSTTQGFSKDFLLNTPKNLTIGYFEEFLISSDIDPIIKSQYKCKLESLEKNGVQLKPITINLMHYAAQIYYIIACAEASSNLARYQGVYFGQSLCNTTSNNSNDYWEEISKYRSSFFGKEVQKRIMLGSYVLSSEKFDAIYKKAIKLRKDLNNEITSILMEVDYLMLPTFPTTTPTWESINKMTTAEIYLADYMTIGFSLAGLPVVTLPTTKTFNIEKTTGIQIVGKKFGDYQLIKDCILLSK